MFELSTPPSQPAAAKPGDAQSAAGRCVLFIGGGPWQLGFIRAGRQLGLDLHVVDGSNAAPGLALASHAHVVNITDIDAVARLAREIGAEAIVSGAADVGARTLSALPPEAKPFSPANGDWNFLLHKELVYARLESAGVPVPRFRVVTNAADALAAAPYIGFPLIVKPTDSAGGRGVARIDKAEDILPAYENAKALGRSGRVLIEEFIAGIGVGFEGFLVDGKPILEAVLEEDYRGDHPSPCGHALPSTLSEAAQESVKRVIRDAVRALGLQRGSFNVDLRLRAGVPVFLEINPRAGGAGISDLVRVATGFDLTQAVFLAALNLPVQPAGPARPTAVRLLGHEGGGQVSSVALDTTGLNVVASNLAIAPGTQKRPGVEWVGWVMAQADTTEQARTNAELAAGRLDVRFSAPPIP